jgi:uncharacterized protein YlxW (UPF0749 family)
MTDEELKTKRSERYVIAIYVISNMIAWLFLYVYVHNYSGFKKIDVLEKANKELMIKFDSLRNENKELNYSLINLNNKIDSLKNSDNSFKNLFNENQKKIQSLESKYNKISRVDNFTSDDIRRYFSNYK